MRRKLSELLFEKDSMNVHNFLLNEERLIQETSINWSQIKNMLKKIVTGFNSKKIEQLSYQDIIKLLNVPIAGFNMNAVGSRAKSQPEDKVSVTEFNTFFKKWDMIPFIIEDNKTDQEISGNIGGEIYHIITFIPKLGMPISNKPETLALHKEIFGIDTIPDKGYTYQYLQMKKLPPFVVNDAELEKLKASFRSGSRMGFTEMIKNNAGNKRLVKLTAAAPEKKGLTDDDS